MNSQIVLDVVEQVEDEIKSERECWENLCNAIIEQAVQDYKNAEKASKLEPENPLREYRVKQARDFFTSDWYKMLTSIDGAALLSMLDREVTVYG